MPCKASKERAREREKTWTKESDMYKHEHKKVSTGGRTRNRKRAKWTGISRERKHVREKARKQKANTKASAKKLHTRRESFIGDGEALPAIPNSHHRRCSFTDPRRSRRILSHIHRCGVRHFLQSQGFRNTENCSYSYLVKAFLVIEVSKETRTETEIDGKEERNDKEIDGFLKNKAAVCFRWWFNFQIIYRSSMDTKIYVDISVVVSDKQVKFFHTHTHTV